MSEHIDSKIYLLDPLIENVKENQKEYQANRSKTWRSPPNIRKIQLLSRPLTPKELELLRSVEEASFFQNM